MTRLCGALLALGLAGCIGGARDMADVDGVDTLTGDAPDLVDGDTEDGADQDSAAEDTRPDLSDTSDTDDARDTGEVIETGDATDTIDGAEVVVPECVRDGDCKGPIGQCESWYCDDGTCQRQPLIAGPCDDGDPCTTNDFCDNGACASAGVLRCDGFAADCWSGGQTVCVPGAGCGGTFQPEGEACTDAVGPKGGECVQGWVVPSDTCDGEGLCVDKSTLVPPGVHPLAANWHFVVSSAESGRQQYTSRGNLNLGASGGLTLSNATSTSAIWTAAANLGGRGNPNAASYCASLEGEILLRYSALEYHGRSDPNRRLIVLRGAREELGIAVRQGGSPTSVNGIYRMVSTAQYGFIGDRLMVWQGQIGFTNGCVTDAGGFSTTPGLGDSFTYDTGNDYCLTPDGSNFRLRLRIRRNDGEHFDIQWYGAIGPTGELMLMTRDDGSQLRYGTILLMRQRDAASVGSTAGSLDFVGQRGGVRTAGDLASNAFLEHGRLELGTSTRELSGAVTRDGVTTALTGVWWYPGVGGRYNQRYALGDELINHTGWISESTNVFVGWRVNDPEVDADTPQNLSLVPYEGSLLVAVRWVPFARPFR